MARRISPTVHKFQCVLSCAANSCLFSKTWVIHKMIILRIEWKGVQSTYHIPAAVEMLRKYQSFLCQQVFLSFFFYTWVWVGQFWLYFWLWSTRECMFPASIRRILSLAMALCAQLLSRVWLFVTPMDCSPPGSSVRGILQPRILEWVAISSSRGSSWLRDQTHVSSVSCTGSLLL